LGCTTDFGILNTVAKRSVSTCHRRLNASTMDESRPKCCPQLNTRGTIASSRVPHSALTCMIKPMRAAELAWSGRISRRAARRDPPSHRRRCQRILVTCAWKPWKQSPTHSAHRPKSTAPPGVADVAARLGSDAANNFVVGAFVDGVLVGTAGFYSSKNLNERHKGPHLARLRDGGHARLRRRPWRSFKLARRGARNVQDLQTMNR
jgi:hypothetical protein